MVYLNHSVPLDPILPLPSRSMKVEVTKNSVEPPFVQPEHSDLYLERGRIGQET